MKTRIALFTAIIVSVCPVLASAGDWPMWRYGSQRGAASPDALPKTLQPQWVRDLPTPKPAWPSTQQRLQFDASYNPVVAGSRLFIGSAVDDSIRAYSTEDGRELWRFTTDGPIRFAPVAVKGNVYVTSDDGHLYCLNAETGNLNWKVNGGPAQRPIIGNHRLISSWPARGGAVYADGVIYFAAGIWPSMGIFIHAVDAESGKIIWTNSKTGSLYVVHPHGAPSFGSIVPQGHLVISGDSLIIPGGRSVPAVLNRKTGKLKYFKFDKRAGDHHVMAGGGSYFVGGGRYSLKDGVSAGSAAPDAITTNLTITSSKTKLTADDLQGKVVRRLKKDRKGRPTIVKEFRTETKWTLQPTAGSPTKLFCVAGNQLYTGGKDRVARFVVPQKNAPAPSQQKADWSAAIEGDVWSIIAADDRLFVVTITGKLYCFGSDKREVFRHQPLSWKPAKRNPFGNGKPVESRPLKRPAHSSASRDLPYVLMIGLPEDLDLIQKVKPDGQHQFIAVDPRPKAIDQLRTIASNNGWYGRSVTAYVGTGVNFPFPPYIASKIICANLKTAGVDFTPESLANLYRPLRPYGGKALLMTSDREHLRLLAVIKKAKLPNAKVTRENAMTVIEKVGALPDSSGWTHQYGSASNSVVSKDALVKAPLGVLWFGGPTHDGVLPRHGHGPNPQVAGGRLVIEGADMLRAVDVYTGRLLWETKLKGVGQYFDTTRHFAGAGEIGSNYVTLPDAVYVSYGSKLLELDAATGKQRRVFTLPKDGNREPVWGALMVDGDYLIATSTPVRIAGGQQSGNSRAFSVPKNFQAIIADGATWKYAAGTDPNAGWIEVDFDDSKWPAGKSGFGYGDGDDRTKLKMQNKYSRVYLRNTFDAASLKSAKALQLAINFDDAFIAYLNGKEILRVGVSSGRGAKAKGIKSHEAEGFETFSIADFRKLLRPGKNVLAIEGHNTSRTSSDFSLAPVLIAKTESAIAGTTAKPSTATTKPPLEPARYSSASKRLVVINRKTGKRLWQREAEFNFRHNGIAAANGKVFCIDGLSPEKIQQLKRRGVKAAGKARLLAIDAKTGNVIWETRDRVTGTFLNYSDTHDVLLQAGSAYRDRAKDEVSQGMTAYRGIDGKVIWRDSEIKYGGPCLLWKDKIITNGGGGYQLELLTGKKTGWSYGRMYGCNTAVGSEHLLTFRSGAAGFCDLAGDSGTGNIGGFRSSCTSNLIAADGVLNAPDYTRTCSCAYQNQTSLALIHMPKNEFWTFNMRDLAPGTMKRIGWNLGAPGDRRDQDGTLWLEYPTVGGPSPKLSVSAQPDNVKWYQNHSSTVSTGDRNWVASSGGEGIESLTIKFAGKKSSGRQKFTVRLYFAEPKPLKPGERVFSVSLQGRILQKDLDIVKSAGAANRVLIREFSQVEVGQTLQIGLSRATMSKYPPILCGVELIRESP